jgi:hypothetical protein
MDQDQVVDSIGDVYKTQIFGYPNVLLEFDR